MISKMITEGFGIKKFVIIILNIYSEKFQSGLKLNKFRLIQERLTFLLVTFS